MQFVPSVNDWQENICGLHRDTRPKGEITTPELAMWLSMLMMLAAFLYYLSCNPGPGEGACFKALLGAMRITAMLLVALVITAVIWVFT